jgi:hypothetical protein
MEPGNYRLSSRPNDRLLEGGGAYAAFVAKSDAAQWLQWVEAV